MPCIAEILKEAAKTLQAAGVDEPRREAASLLALALAVDRSFLVAHSGYELNESEMLRYRDFILRRADREPFQHIAGRQEFYGLDFVVTPDVLIPRPETEAIVETALEILKNEENQSFCEVGIGSGCISVSILHEDKRARAVGLDISEKALRIAALNAEKHNVVGRLRLEISNVFAALQSRDNDSPKETFDLIVSNPPYIPASQISDLQPEVRDFDPLEALTDGADGLTVIREIVENAPIFLNPGGWLLLEIGFGQAETVRRMFAGETWQGTEVLPDLRGIPRTVKARINGKRKTGGGKMNGTPEDF